MSASASSAARSRGGESVRHERDRLEPEPDSGGFKEAGVGYATKEALFATADIITVHVVLGPRSRGLVGAAEWRG